MPAAPAPNATASPARNIRRTRLPNGLLVLTESIPHVRSVSMGIWIDSGSRDEYRSLNGISHFVEHMVFKGTTTRSAQQTRPRGRTPSAATSMPLPAKRASASTRKVLDEYIQPALDLLDRPHPPPHLQSRRHRPRAGRHRRRDQDGRGQPRLPRPRNLHPELLEGPLPRPSHPRQQKDRLQLHPANCLRLLRWPLHSAQHGFLRRRPPRPRQLCRPGLPTTSPASPPPAKPLSRTLPRPLLTPPPHHTRRARSRLSRSSFASAFPHRLSTRPPATPSTC